MNDGKGDKLIRVDMHCHTRLSKDCLMIPRKLVETAAGRGLGALCVTDHNALAAAMALSRLPELPIKVIPSEEVKSSEGEIIGYFLSELVPKGLAPEETAKRIKGQGGLVAVPHPFELASHGQPHQGACAGAADGGWAGGHIGSAERPLYSLTWRTCSGRWTSSSRRGRSPGARRRETGAARKKRVLVVDDSITVREVERQLLLHKGYEVAVAVDGMDGWNRCGPGGST